ncbi:MAG TPA: hypothetical protein VND64_07560, partial [Pirellulales bacterium]|nr:hypothetical protein [Pirellulales bacterium]
QPFGPNRRLRQTFAVGISWEYPFVACQGIRPSFSIVDRGVLVWEILEFVSCHLSVVIGHLLEVTEPGRYHHDLRSSTIDH